MKRLMSRASGAVLPGVLVVSLLCSSRGTCRDV